MTTLPTGSKIGGRQVLNNGSKVLFVDGRDHLEAMRQLQVEGNTFGIYQQILDPLIVLENKEAISDAEVIKLCKLANKVIQIVCCDSLLWIP